GGEMFRVECDAILRIPDNNSGAVEIQTAWSIDKVPVELNVPILHATKTIEVPDISTSDSQGLYANFRARSQGLKIQSFASSIDRYIKHAGQLLRQCQRVKITPSDWEVTMESWHFSSEVALEICREPGVGDG